MEKVDFVHWKEAEVPRATDTYQPIGHQELIDLVSERLSLQGYTIIRFTVDQNKTGERIAFKMILKKEGMDDMTLMFAGMNSYDKSLAVKFASGASVFVCDNGMIVGDIVSYRKHTSNIMNDLTELIDKVAINLKHVWQKTIADVATMKTINMPDEDTASLFGRLLITEGIITSTELNEAVRELRNPSFVDFEPKTLWSTYNHVTWALKKAPVHRKLDCLKRLHDVCMEYAYNVINLEIGE